jgi:phospholipid/cholesterol/gamma-HCH transport system permease protein
MSPYIMTVRPLIDAHEEADRVAVTLSGDWTAAQAGAVKECLGVLQDEAIRSAKLLILDFSGIGRLDTLGGWSFVKLRFSLGEDQLEFSGLRKEQRLLLEEIRSHEIRCPSAKPPEGISGHLADLGEGVVLSGHHFADGIAFLGEVMVAFSRVIREPRRFRFTSVIHQMESIAFKGVPIIVLISFLVGCIVAQQGIFQLQKFGAAPFVVDLVGILVLRELGVLLTAIMVAGRSGSAFTAEIGSMKMREEIDALRVMGLDPMEVLILPRIIALILSLPLLTLLASLAALYGGGLVAWFYGGISPDVYLARLQGAIKFNTFMIGLIKAPFMALVIGLIASMEGLKVKGSAESLGQQVTSSVVKAIFMVIVLDGIFAMFFAAIRY